MDLKENQWANGKWDVSFPGDQGESFRSIVDRMEQGFVDLGRLHRDGANIIVATHSQCIEAFLVYLKAFSYNDIEERSKNKNCKDVTISTNPRFDRRSSCQLGSTRVSRKLRSLSLLLRV